MIGRGEKIIRVAKKMKLVEERKKFLQLKGRTRIKGNKTISDGGITVDFSIIKVHTSN